MASFVYNFFFLLDNVGAKAESAANVFFMTFGEKMLQGYLNSQ